MGSNRQAAWEGEWTAGSERELQRHLVSALELEDRTRVIGARDFETKSLDDLPDFCDLRGVRFGELSRSEPQRILKANTHVATHRGRHRGDGHLIAARAQHRPMV